MFKNDKKYVNEHTLAATKFFTRFFWRFMLLTLGIVILPVTGLAYLLAEGQSKFLYIAVIVMGLLSGYLAALISFKMIRDSTVEDKRAAKITRMIFKDDRAEESGERFLLARLSFAFYWRSFVLASLISLIAYFLSLILNIDLLVGSRSFILNFATLMMGWYWFVLYNPRKGAYIDLVVVNAEDS